MPINSPKAKTRKNRDGVNLNLNLLRILCIIMIQIMHIIMEVIACQI